MSDLSIITAQRDATRRALDQCVCELGRISGVLSGVEHESPGDNALKVAQWVISMLDRVVDQSTSILELADHVSNDGAIQ
jgi:hypothetical protein